ncbi:MAG: phosphate ABC transporter permease subunit PstC [Bacteroidia bacterium]|nr:phosphate ABC transporter permease subunit PstC [Bacteroidia bacterium]HQV00924.1 phosphate ABC transporter permease subunit PstC [Bacteroidia bacterium]
MIKHFLKDFKERFIEGVLFLSSTTTSILVVLIVVYLFKEGVGIFNRTPVAEGSELLVSAANKVNKLTADEVRKIFEQEFTKWNQVGGSDAEIELFRLDDITNYYTDEQLGENFENMPHCIDTILMQHPNMIAFVSKQYVLPNGRACKVSIDKIAVKQVMLGNRWYPTASPVVELGIWPLLLGTIWVSIGAILLALPFGLAAAIYMAEIADSRIRKILKPLIELLAGIPSVVYGFFGLVVMVPIIQQTFNLDVGQSALAGSIILGIMALPTIITISEDAIRNTPRAMREASLALGANHWQTIVRVVLPYSVSGITAAVILGIGRAIGETMAVLMVTGNAAVVPTSFLQPVRTIPATIAAELGEAPFGGIHFQALFFLGCMLFLLTFIINVIVEMLAPKKLKR